MADNTGNSSKTIEEVLIENLQGPKSAEVDGQKVEQHSLSDQIKAAEYLAKKQLAKSGKSGIKFTFMSHSGTN